MDCTELTFCRDLGGLVDMVLRLRVRRVVVRAQAVIRAPVHVIIGVALQRGGSPAAGEARSRSRGARNGSGCRLRECVDMGWRDGVVVVVSVHVRTLTQVARTTGSPMQETTTTSECAV